MSTKKTQLLYFTLTILLFIGSVQGQGPSNCQLEKNKNDNKIISDDEFHKLTENLFTNDQNNVYRKIKFNLQKKTTGDNPNDEAPQPLFEIDPEVFEIPTIAQVLTIHDNYKLDTRTTENISQTQRNEEILLIDTFMKTSVMSMAMKFLADKGLIKNNSNNSFKKILTQLWFGLYPRKKGGIIGSSGFEHVFLTETTGTTELSGLHNWIFFNAEEKKKRADYRGYVRKLNLGDKAVILEIHAKFNGIDKPVTSMFVGTSPELEMALYTVCFFVRVGKYCNVSLGGTKFDIVKHKIIYHGIEHIGSAYPALAKANIYNDN